jgi:hypothetical protein
MNEFEGNADVPSMLALIAFVSLWGLVASTAAMYFAALGY